MVTALESNRKIFGIFLLLALIWHLLWFWVLPRLNFGEVTHRVELQPFTPTQLDQLREKWKQRERTLLLQKNPNAPRAKEAPKDARYESDRNQIVEKETRAQVTDVLPKPGAQVRPVPQSHSQAQSQPKQSSKSQSAPRKLSLGNLGVPMHLGKSSQVRSEEEEISRPATPPMQAGADQALLDKNLQPGAENMLNTQESVYYSFYARIYEAIGPLWQSYIRDVSYQQRVAKGEYTTVCDVVFDSTGNIVAVNILRGSGVTGFDSAVQRAWKKLERFPNPPRSLIGQDGLGHTGWTFAVAVGEGFNVDYLPPSREY